MTREMKVNIIKENQSFWKNVKVKRLFNVERGRVIAKSEISDNINKNNIYPVYSSQTQNMGIMGYINTYDYDKDILSWTTDGANAGTVFIRSGKYNCTNVCGILIPKIEFKNMINLEFMKYAVGLSAIKNRKKDILGYKLMSNEMADSKIIFPIYNEQQKISNFLDKKTDEIDSLISNTEKSIELLKEYKQSLITETVTKGLDPNVTMKDSEVEWIGEIPEHWSTHKLKNIVVENLQYGSNNSGINFDNNNPRYIRITDIDENGNLYETNKQSLKIDNSNKYLLEENDILFARSGATVGKTYIHKNYYGLCAFAGYLVRAKINSNNNPNFVYYFTKSEIFEKWINIVKTKATIENVSADKYNELIIPLPIKKEQDDIVLFLNNKLKKVNNIIVYKNEILSELIRYKQSLIYEYVTGKKEVPDGY